MRTKLGAISTIVIGMLICLVWVPAYAGGWSQSQTTKYLSKKTDRTVIVSGTEGAWGNPDLCDNDSTIVLLVKPSNTEWYKETYALLLGAHLTGRKITARLSGCKLIGSSTFPVITTLKVL